MELERSIQTTPGGRTDRPSAGYESLEVGAAVPRRDPVDLPSPSVQAPLSPLGRLIRDASSGGPHSIRWDAVHALGACREPEAFEALVSIAEDQSWELPGHVRAEAIRAMAANPDKREVSIQKIHKLAESFLGEYEPTLNQQACKAVACALHEHAGHLESDSYIERFLVSGDPRQRAMMLAAMGQQPIKVWEADRNTSLQVWPGKGGEGFDLHSVNRGGHLVFVQTEAAMSGVEYIRTGFLKDYYEAAEDDRQAAFEAAKERGDFEV